MKSLKSEMNEHLVYTDFVHIDLCVVLYRMGLTAQVSHEWHVNHKNEAVLSTWAFDPEAVYEQMFINSQALLSVTGDAERIFPAYSLGDMEKLLPDFTLTRTGRLYEIMIDHAYPIQPVTAERLPGAAARMVQHLLTARFLNPEQATARLQNTA